MRALAFAETRKRRYADIHLGTNVASAHRDRSIMHLHWHTQGFGEVIRNALDRGVQKLLLCIGGSATNDGGAGMASALGYRFFRIGRCHAHAWSQCCLIPI